MVQQSKQCSLCKEVKPVALFPKSKGGKFGVRGNCKACEKIRQKTYRADNREKIKSLWKSWYEDNKERRVTQWKDYYENNGDRVRESSRKRKRANPHKYLAYNSKRRAAKVTATPLWLSQSQTQEIEDLYWLAKDLQRVTGLDYHVDHIVPLQGKEVCGLRVPWNLQVLPSDLNLKKGNRLAAEAQT